MARTRPSVAGINAPRDKAKAAGMSVSAYMAHPPKGISSTTKHEIALAKTLATLRKQGRGK